MPYEQRDNSGSLFRNDKRETEQHPTLKGSAMIGGVEYWVSAWVKVSKTGEKWQSLAFTPKEQQHAPPALTKAGDPCDDDLSHQGLQWMLADMAVAGDAARGLTQRAIDTLLRGERGTMEASTAKLFATEALGRVVDAAVQIHGGMGYMREAGIETTCRDARIVRIYEGTSEIQRNIIAGLLLKDQ